MNKLTILVTITMVVLVICVILMALCVRLRGASGEAPDGEAPDGEAPGDEAFGDEAFGGGVKKKSPDPKLSPHIVVDTLNMAHWLAPKHGAKMSPEFIVETIDRTAPILKQRHAGRVMYVLKDRETAFNDEAARSLYDQAAKRNGVIVFVVERYSDPPSGTRPTAEHSARGRDDFYIALLAYRWRCAVLTEDRLRDFDRFRATIPPFHVYEYAFWRDLPHREFVRPESSAYARIRKPTRVGYEAYPFPR